MARGDVLHGIIELYIKVRSFLTARLYVQRHCCLKKIQRKRPNFKGKIMIFTKKAMNYRERRRANYVIFTLPQLIVVGL